MTEVAADKINHDWNKEDSVFSIRLSDIKVCRICQIDDQLSDELISPCHCSGSVGLVHEGCINSWINISNRTECEICCYSFPLKKETRWEWLPLLPWEKKNLIRLLASTLVVLILVAVSLYAVIDSSVAHFGRADFQRRFWTNIILETLGGVGVSALILFHGRFYIKLILRLIDHNIKFVIDTSSLPPNQKKMTPDEQATPTNSENVDLPAMGKIESTPVLSKLDSSNITCLEIELDDFGNGFLVNVPKVPISVGDCF